MKAKITHQIEIFYLNTIEQLIHFFEPLDQGLVKGAILCFRNLYFYFRHGESTSTASQKSKDLNKIPFLLQDLTLDQLEVCLPY